jgi:hypothetical protein
MDGLVGVDVVREAEHLITTAPMKAEWDEVPKRTVIEVTQSYLSGADAQAYAAWLSVVGSVLADFDCKECHRETLIIKAFALLKWLRLIVCSAYVFRESQYGEFENNLVPVFIGKLGEFLAALSMWGEMPPEPPKISLKDLIHNTLTEFSECGSGVGPTMHLSSDMIHQIVRVYMPALYSGPAHFKLLNDLRLALKEPSRAPTQRDLEWWPSSAAVGCIKTALAGLCADDKYYHDVGRWPDHTFQMKSDNNKSLPPDPTCVPLSPRCCGTLSPLPSHLVYFLRSGFCFAGLKPSGLRRRLITLHNALIDLVCGLEARITCPAMD